MKEKAIYMETYEAPRVEIIEVEVEQGFAASSTILGGTTHEESMTGGGELGVGW